MRTKPLSLVLITLSLGLPLLADAPVPTPTPATGKAPAPAATASADATPTPSPTPVPTMPSTLTLTNGTVLHNVTVIRWLKDSVTVKHTGGADTIRYNYISEDDRAAVLAARDEAMKHQKADSSPKPADNSVKGTVFVAGDDGADAPLAGVAVYAVRMDALGMLSTDLTRVVLPKPLASSVTGADGQFSMVVPAGEDFFIFAKATKFVGQVWQHYEWRLPISQVGDRQGLALNGGGIVPLADQKAVTFEK